MHEYIVRIEPVHGGVGEVFQREAVQAVEAHVRVFHRRGGELEHLGRDVARVHAAEATGGAGRDPSAAAADFQSGPGRQRILLEQRQKLFFVLPLVSQIAQRLVALVFAPASYVIVPVGVIVDGVLQSADDSLGGGERRDDGFRSEERRGGARV